MPRQELPAFMQVAGYQPKQVLKATRVEWRNLLIWVFCKCILAGLFDFWGAQHVASRKGIKLKGTLSFSTASCSSDCSSRTRRFPSC